MGEDFWESWVYINEYNIKMSSTDTQYINSFTLDSQFPMSLSSIYANYQCQISTMNGCSAEFYMIISTNAENYNNVDISISAFTGDNNWFEGKCLHTDPECIYPGLQAYAQLDQTAYMSGISGGATVYIDDDTDSTALTIMYGDGYFSY